MYKNHSHRLIQTHALCLEYYDLAHALYINKELMARTTRPSANKPRKYLCLEDKYKAIQQVRSGTSIAKVAADFGIGKSQMYNLYKQRESLPKRGVHASVHAKVLCNKAKHKEIDQSVFEWFCSIRGQRKPLPVSKSLLKARALFEAKLRGISNFKASDGWVYNWRWRYNIGKSVRLHGEASDVNLEEAEKAIEELRATISVGGYKVQNIFNMDETALFFRAIPSTCRSYLMSTEGDIRVRGRGCKSMHAKERLTLMLCTNATGTLKISPVIIGSAKKPRCFKDNPPRVPYLHQKNAWTDKVTYGQWWDIFLKQIRSWTSDPVVLLIDGFSGHDLNCTDPLGQVRVIMFPPIVTSIYQPLDQGIIATLKAFYKAKLLGRLVSTAPSFTNLQLLAKDLPQGCVGLTYGCPPHVSDATELVKEAWNNISPSTIAACWQRAQCISASDAADVATSSIEYKTSVEADVITNMCSMLSTLHLSEPSVADMVDKLGMKEIVHGGMKPMLNQ